MTYETLSQIAQQGGTLYFAAIFLAGLAYALWPKNGETFSRLAQLPLEDAELTND